MKINDFVRVKHSWHSEHYDRYYGCKLHGEKGTIVDIIAHNEEIEGYRVQFPAITIWDQDNKEKIIRNFVWPFRASDLEKADGKVQSTPRRSYRKGKQLQSLQSAAQRLRKRGMKIKDIARQLEVPEGTIKRWSHLEREKKVRSGVQKYG